MENLVEKIKKRYTIYHICTWHDKKGKAGWQKLLAPPQTLHFQQLLGSEGLTGCSIKSSSLLILPKISKAKKGVRENVEHIDGIHYRQTKMKPIEDKKDTVTIRAVSHDKKSRKRVEKTELSTHNIDTIRYIEKKLEDKAVQRMERHSADGLGIGRPPPKSGHGGKYTWEGPDDLAESELNAVPAAIDEKDPNYVDEEAEEKIVRGEESGVAGLVVGEVEAPKAAEVREGVARVEVDPHLKVN